MTWHARGPFQTTACRNTSARMAQPSSICSSVIVKAGSSRMTWPCVALIKSRRRMHSATISVASKVKSSPIIVPMMRISRTRPGSSARIASNWSRNRSPMAAPRSSRPSASMVSMAASAARQAIGLPPKVEACIPGLSTAATDGRAIITPGRDPAGQGLGAGQDVGHDAFVLVREPFAGTAHAGLDLVEDQEHAAPVAQPPQPREIAGRRDVDPPLALDRLDQNRGRLVVEHRGDRLEVVVRNIDEAGNHRLEPDVVLGLGGGRQCGVGPAVEPSLHRDDLEAPLLVTEGPGQLDGGLVGLGPAVAEEALAAERPLGQGLGERPWASMYQVFGTWINWPTWSRTASTTRGGQWPSRLQPQPGKKSRYRLPSASQIHDPSPLTRLTG